MFKNRFFVYLFLGTAVACHPAHQVTTTPKIATTPPVTIFQPYGPAWAALWQQQAAEYKALCLQAYQLAAWRVDQDLLQSHSKPLAIVTDIDETILDNSPNTVHQALQGKGFNEKDWEEWTAKATADTVPGALTFFKYAAAKGIDIFYISNRSEAERSGTLQNLQRWNFPQATGDHLVLRGTASSKEGRREAVASTHEIILLVGDNLGDFSAAFENQLPDARTHAVQNAAADFGKRFIILPNVMYGDWEPSLYHYKRGLSILQKDAILRSSLRNY
ncbi:5'-nucleotidase, lipoprotein e(P4) family [Chitinophaga costaii]|uniref:5'-nucleotidase, lipoprotein e(P4) family n=1 Tax=Chitinophaga costaii TaxID=1335309 RepID=A0A1C4BX71_9BACT|nr:5'-nucleotidase, lipoprotein e(P4) family [Chitinophaga costaii]PUZ27438.1 5'-nucleotidase, lipoprotein e(P4) family [Chitinophaga costaii]SCC11388.1 5'-nucleotidase, lipoprotein e(P4) family [Chitinophaga costaii]